MAELIQIRSNAFLDQMIEVGMQAGAYRTRSEYLRDLVRRDAEKALKKIPKSE